MFSFKSIVLVAAAIAVSVDCSAVPALPAVAAAPLYAPAHVGYTQVVPQNIPPYAAQINVVNRAVSPLFAASAFAAPLAAPLAAAPYAPYAAAPYVAAPAALAGPAAFTAPAAFAAPAALAAHANLAASPAFAVPSAYAAPLSYAAAGAPLLRSPFAHAALVR